MACQKPAESLLDAESKLMCKIKHYLALHVLDFIVVFLLCSISLNSRLETRTTMLAAREDQLHNSGEVLIRNFVAFWV